MGGENEGGCVEDVSSGAGVCCDVTRLAKRFMFASVLREKAYKINIDRLMMVIY